MCPASILPISEKKQKMAKTCFCDSSPSLKPAWLVLRLRREFLRGTSPRVCFVCHKNKLSVECRHVCVCVCVSCWRRHWIALGFVKGIYLVSPVLLQPVAALHSSELLPYWCFGPSAGTPVTFPLGETWGHFCFAAGGVF